MRARIIACTVMLGLLICLESCTTSTHTMMTSSRDESLKTTAQNPVIAGFYPDPSICRVGDDFYLVASSFEYFPGVPIFHSRDLVHWEQIGYCLSRPSQLPLEKCPSSTGIYAPTIRFHDGRFYMVTTNVTGGGNFFVTASDPAGPWSEPTWIKGPRGIDPSFLFDDDGKVYFSESAGGGVEQWEIDLASGEAKTKPRVVWHGTGGQHPEAPHLYKIQGQYYLMIAEGGTEYGHMETIARSSSPWGPFQACPQNPILSHRSTSRPNQATGHADLVQLKDGSWFAVFLAIRPVMYPPRHHLGRETNLSPVHWTNDGWPIFGEHGLVPAVFDVPLAPHPWPAPATRDDFDSPALALPWNFLRNPRAQDWSLSEKPGWLSLHGSAITLND